MVDFTDILLLFILITVINYTGLIIYLTIGWYKLPVYKSIISGIHTKISILIPFRNEEKTIINCLSWIAKQDFPSHLMEIILIDDHSTDSSLEKVIKFKQSNPGFKIQVIELKKISKDNGSKKLAIKEGIALSGGELIITTDADCQMGEKWLNNLVSYYEKHRANMIVAPVSYINDHTLFGSMQHLEFLSLQSSGASAIGINHPIMANGANLAYRKEIFYDVHGFEGNEEIASGDDVFLLQQIHKKYPGTVHFIKSYDAMVFTSGPKSISGFINQRKRWASKSKNYQDIFAKYVAISVFLFCLSLLLCLSFFFFNTKLILYFAIFYMVKMVIDIPLLNQFTSFVRRRKLLVLVPFLELIYPIYVVFIALDGLFGSYQWKDRRNK